MALKKLPLSLQSKFRASAQIRCFKTAVEELVYNALDAKSSSIAIRVDIKNSYIQVVDNGYGVAKYDFNILGERYTTSKFENDAINEPVSIYGRCGQSLANIIEVSQSVKITSKCMNNEETWMKRFCNGKEEACSIITERPSVGTTVEIKGFLYNLSIQKKTVKELEELQNIKTFLEQMALIHCNTSVSLRDNSRNEIIFKVHKNRDIIQTFASTLNICTSNLQELQVEKNHYKVTGYIQNNNEEAKGYQWIYVNGRYIDKSNLHKMVNENLAKGAPTKRNMKTKSYNNEEEKVVPDNRLPDYFLFIKCPAIDYDLISHPNQSILEFKNVVHINKLLDKLIKIYTGDIKFVKVTTTSKGPTNKCKNSNVPEIDTKNKVKEIMEKILGSHQKKMNGSNLHNGVKGKIIRRKIKTKGNSSLKVKLDVQRQLKDVEGIQEEVHEINNHTMTKLTNKKYINNEAVTSFLVPTSKPMTKKKIRNANLLQKHDNNNEHCLHVTNQAQKNNFNHIIKQPDLTNKLKKKKKIANADKTQPNKEKYMHIANKIPEKLHNHNHREYFLSKFEKETDKVHKRCNLLTERVDHLLGVNKKRRRCKIFTNEILHYSNIVKNYRSISVRKKINEIIIHEYVPLSQNVKVASKENKMLKDIKTSNDLICPLMNIINYKNFEGNVKRAKIVQPQADPNFLHFTDTHDSKIPGPTFESHNYLKDIQISRLRRDLIEKSKTNKFRKTSQDNVVLPMTNREVIKIQEIINVREKTNYLEGTDVVKSSYPLTFTKTDSQIQTQEPAVNASTAINGLNQNSSGSTYTIEHSDKPESTKCTNSKNLKLRTYTIETASTHEANVHLYSDQSPNYQNTQTDTADINEKFNNDVVFISNSQLATEKNSIEPIQLCRAVLSIYDKQNHEEIIESTFIFDSINNVIEGNTDIDIQAEDLFKCGTESKRHCSVPEESRIDDCINNYFKNKIACEINGINFEPDNFNLKNRRRYIPKGMSPIFEKCNFNVCNNELDADYFDARVYNNFAQNVQIHSEIFEPKIQNVKEVTTADIQSVDIKLYKDNACLTFNVGSLQNAKVLGQVDNKFIATLLSVDSNGEHNCLVLFDQHAVHERIRLEKNMSEYISHDHWKSILVDGFSLKLTRDEILYLHNYRDKFEKLGLQWSIASDTEVLVNAIPEAILGKRLRQVDIVLKAVNSLIREEINIIKEQGGCVSLYPKSIMNLVFSEACRYAIMFGTALTDRECSTLIEGLSSCRTPFQCAHGRPALAVLVDVMRESHPYTVNFNNVEKFRLKQKKLQNK